MPNMMSSLPSQQQQQQQSSKVVQSLLTPSELFAIAKGVINESLCREIDAIYQFNIQNTNTSTTKTWIVNVKDSPGFVSDSPMKWVVSHRYSMSKKPQIFYGQLSPNAAYMNSTLSVNGSTIVAMKLELLINRLKSV